MSDTELDLEAIEARLAAITPGKWKFDEAADRPLFVDKDNFLVWVSHIFEGDVELAMAKADGEFIANAPVDIAALVARVRELEAENKARFTEGAKETKERVLSAIDMAGLMEAKFGTKDRARVIAEIKLLVQSIGVETE